MYCPVKSNPEWQALVTELGESKALAAWAKLQSQESVKESLNASITYLKEKTGLDIPVEQVKVIGSLVKTGVFGKITDSAIILDQAPADAGYVLAFNRVWQTALNNAEREQLADEVMLKMEDSSISYQDISEILALDFANWKTTGESSFFTKAQEQEGILRRLYQKIIDFVATLVAIRKSDIAGAYLRIDADVYATSVLHDMDTAGVTLGGHSAETTKDFLDTLNYEFFTELFDRMPNLRFVEKKFNSFQVNFSDIYATILNNLGTTDDSIRGYFSTEEGFEEAIKLHSKYLTQFGVSATEIEDSFGSSENVKGRNSEYAESDTISTITISAPIIKLMLSNIPNVNLVGADFYNSVGGVKTFPLTTIWSMVQEAVIDKFNQTSMLDALEKAAQTDPALREVYDLISVSPEGIKNAFFKAFSNTKANGKVMLIKAGQAPTFVDANENNIVASILDTWQQAMRSNDTVYSPSKGLNLAKISGLSKKYSNDAAREFLNALGIEYTGAMNTYLRWGAGRKQGGTVYQMAGAIYEDLVKAAKLTRIDNFGDISKGTYSKVRALAQLEAKNSKYIFIENQGVAPDGTIRYGIVRPNPMDIIRADIVNSTTFEELLIAQPQLSRSFKIVDGVYVFYSAAIEQIYNSYQDGEKPVLDISIVYGARPDRRGAKGNNYKSMQQDEKILMDTSAILNGMMPVRRAGDKGTQRYISGLPNVVSTEEFYDRMWNYFQYEYDQVLDGKPWGLFDGILDTTLKNVLGTDANSSVDVDQLKSVINYKINRYMESYSYDLARVLYDASIISASYPVKNPSNTKVGKTMMRTVKLADLTTEEKKVYSNATVSLQSMMSNTKLWWESDINPMQTAKLILAALGNSELAQAIPIIKDNLISELYVALSIAPRTQVAAIEKLIADIKEENEAGIGFIAYYLDNSSKKGSYPLMADLANYADQIVLYKYAENKIETIHDLTRKFNENDVDLLGEPKEPFMLEANSETIQAYVEGNLFLNAITEGRMTAQNALGIIGSNSASLSDAYRAAEQRAFGIDNSETTIGKNPKAYDKGMLPNTVNDVPLADFVAMNHMVSAMEQHFVFLGDMSNYKLSQYFKRMSMPVGNGSVAITDSEAMNADLQQDYMSMNMINDNYRQHRINNPDSLNFVTILDVKQTSPEAAQYEALVNKFYTETGKDLETVLGNIRKIMAAYNNINVADAASVMLLPYYREFMIRHQSWLPKQEATFQAIDTGSEMPEKLGFFNTIKPKGFGFDTDGDASGIKTSVMPIYKGITANIPELADSGIEELIDIMMDNATDMLSMESAVKVGNPEKVSLTQDGEFTADYNPKTLPIKWFQIQVELPAEVKNEAVEGSQQRMQIFSDLFDQGVADEDIQQAATEYRELYNMLISNEKANFISTIGMTEFNGKFYSTRPDKLIEVIREAATSGNLPMNIVDSLQINPETGEFKFILDSIPASNRIMNVLMARANSNMIRLKKNISGYVQVPNLFLKGKKTDSRLSWVFDDTGNVIGAEVYLPASYARAAKFTAEQIADPSKIPTELLRLLGYRIPTEGPASMSVLIVKGFLPDELGDTLAVPEDIPGVSGSDFDIDKMYIIRPNIGVNGKYLKPITSVDDAWELYETVFVKEISALRGYTTALAYIQKIKNENNIDNPLMAAILDTDLQTIEYEARVEAPMIFKFMKDHGSLPFSKEDYIKLVGDSWMEVNDKERLQNRLLEIEISLMTHPKYSGRNFMANSSNILLEQAEKYTESNALRNYTQLFRMDVEWAIGEAFIAGKDLVGRAALHLKFRTYAQMAGLTLSDTTINEDGVERKVELYMKGTPAANLPIGMRYNYAGELISQLFAQHLTAFVDASADPFIFRLNTNEFTLDAKFFMMHMGAPLDYIDNLLLQPAVMEYVQGLRKVASGINKIKTKGRVNKKTVLDSIIRKYGNLSSFQKKQKFLNLDHFNYTQAFSTEALRAERANPSENQVALLLQFLEYARNGEALSYAINASTQDTKGSGKNLLQAMEYQTRKNSQMDGGIIQNFADIYIKTPLGAFDSSAEDFAIEAFLQLSVLNEPEVRELLQAVIDDMLTRNDSVNTATINKFLQTYISARTFNGSGMNIKSYEDFLKPKEDKRFASGLRNTETLGGMVVEMKKSKLPVSQFLYPAFSIDTAANVPTIFSGLKIDNKRMSPTAADLVTHAFRELNSSEPSKMQRIALGVLAIYGNVNSPTSPSQLIPTDLFGEMFTEFYKRGSVTPEQALDIFYANNSSDYSAVPFKYGKQALILNKVIGGSEIHTALVNKYKASKYIRAEVSKTELINGNVVESKQERLFKLVGYEGNNAVYLAVNRKGLGMMSEFHTNFYSVFLSNNTVHRAAFVARFNELLEDSSFEPTIKIAQITQSVIQVPEQVQPEVVLPAAGKKITMAEFMELLKQSDLDNASREQLAQELDLIAMGESSETSVMAAWMNKICTPKKNK